MRRTALAGVAAAVLACASCGAGDGAPPAGAESSGSPATTTPLRTGPPVPPVPGISAQAVEYRTDRAAGGQVQVTVTDTGDRPFTVTSVAIDSPGFAPLPAVPVTAAFVPGRRTDLPTPYGDPVCDTAAEPAAARLTVVRPSGAVEELRVPMAAESLAAVHTRLCAAAAVQALVAVTVADLVPDGDALTGRLVLHRSGDGEEAVTAVRLEGSVLYTARAELPLELAAGREEASAPVAFTTARCDPHALAETKQPYLMPLAVTVDDGTAVTLDLPLDDSQREQLRQLTARTCTPG
ncbi:hypothetical protein [Blastococcus sp. SYSU D00695]